MAKAGGGRRFWPLFDLRITTPTLELRYADDPLLEQLGAVHAAGVVAPGTEPFDGNATFYEPGPGSQRWIRGQWSARGRTSPEWWVLVFAVLVGGRPVGTQEVVGIEFPRLRTVGTFSWLAPELRGRGIGKEMRRAVLELAFAGLGALRAESETFEDNVASQRVSLGLGYEANGTTWALRPSGGAPMLRYRLTRERWEQLPGRADVQIHGLTACLPVLGLDGRDPAAPPARP